MCPGGQMKALVYHGEGKKSWDEVPDPKLMEPTDAIVQVDTTTICGTDLHILKGDMPAVTAGRILGHEGVGTVLEVGSSVRNLKVGDTVAVVGAGPVGLSVIATASLYGAAQIVAVDLDEKRLDLAKQVGATHVINSGASDWKEQVFALTDGYGVDVAIEAVGVPATFEMCTQLVRPGGNVANVGVHGKAVMLELQDLWIKNINISMGLVNMTTLGMLLKLVKQEMLPVDKFVTHRFAFDEVMSAYETFGNAAETGALKVLISR